ncbi:MAG: 4-phosphoerythronate dehydrogenase [Candidatus Cryptobacteroides sp.]
MINGKLKIVADKYVPFLQGVFEPYCEIEYMEGGEISKKNLIDADALLIRTRTKCNEDLLEGTAIKMIATATIGEDHIDLDYCKSKGIAVRNAAGCNAGGVMNYFFSALYGTASRNALRIEGNTIGIIGVGNVGKKIESVGRALGFKILKYDPPRAEAEGDYGFSSLEYLLENSQIVTMHTPLDEKTRGMANAEFFSRMLPGAFFINASRGEVVNEKALMDTRTKLGPVILDTWNNEPDVNKELIGMVDIATPHIAGYSYQGKQNGTAAAVKAIARYFGIEQLYDFFPPADIAELESQKLDLRGKNQGEITALLQYNYPIFTDDFMFRMNPDNFEQLRSEYKYRREFFLD